MNHLRNHVQLIGHLAKEVEFEKSESGKSIARVSLATKEVLETDTGDKVVEVHWHHLVGCGKVAEIMQVLLKKGKEVAIQGKLIHRPIQNNNGQTHFLSEVVVNEFMLLR